MGKRKRASKTSISTRYGSSKPSRKGGGGGSVGVRPGTVSPGPSTGGGGGGRKRPGKRPGTRTRPTPSTTGGGGGGRKQPGRRPGSVSRPTPTTSDVTKTKAEKRKIAARRKRKQARRQQKRGAQGYAKTAAQYTKRHKQEKKEKTKKYKDMMDRAVTQGHRNRIFLGFEDPENDAERQLASKGKRVISALGLGGERARKGEERYDYSSISGKGVFRRIYPFALRGNLIEQEKAKIRQYNKTKPKNAAQRSQLAAAKKTARERIVKLQQRQQVSARRGVAKDIKAAQKADVPKAKIKALKQQRRAFGTKAHQKARLRGILHGESKRAEERVESLRDRARALTQLTREEEMSVTEARDRFEDAGLEARVIERKGGQQRGTTPALRAGMTTQDTVVEYRKPGTKKWKRVRYDPQSVSELEAAIAAAGFLVPFGRPIVGAKAGISALLKGGGKIAGAVGRGPIGKGFAKTRIPAAAKAVGRGPKRVQAKHTVRQADAAKAAREETARQARNVAASEAKAAGKSGKEASRIAAEAGRKAGSKDLVNEARRTAYSAARGQGKSLKEANRLASAAARQTAKGQRDVRLLPSVKAVDDAKALLSRSPRGAKTAEAAYRGVGVAGRIARRHKLGTIGTTALSINAVQDPQDAGKTIGAIGGALATSVTNIPNIQVSKLDNGVVNILEGVARMGKMLVTDKQYREATVAGMLELGAGIAIFPYFATKEVISNGAWDTVDMFSKTLATDVKDRWGPIAEGNWEEFEKQQRTSPTGAAFYLADIWPVAVGASAGARYGVLAGGQVAKVTGKVSHISPLQKGGEATVRFLTEPRNDLRFMGAPEQLTAAERKSMRRDADVMRTNAKTKKNEAKGLRDRVIKAKKKRTAETRKRVERDKKAGTRRQRTKKERALHEKKREAAKKREQEELDRATVLEAEAKTLEADADVQIGRISEEIKPGSVEALGRRPQQLSNRLVKATQQRLLDYARQKHTNPNGKFGLDPHGEVLAGQGEVIPLTRLGLRIEQKRQTARTSSLHFLNEQLALRTVQQRIKRLQGGYRVEGRRVEVGMTDTQRELLRFHGNFGLGTTADTAITQLLARKQHILAEEKLMDIHGLTDLQQQSLWSGRKELDVIDGVVKEIRANPEKVFNDKYVDMLHEYKDLVGQAEQLNPNLRLDRGGTAVYETQADYLVRQGKLKVPDEMGSYGDPQFRKYVNENIQRVNKAARDEGLAEPFFVPSRARAGKEELNRKIDVAWNDAMVKAAEFENPALYKIGRLDVDPFDAVADIGESIARFHDVERFFDTLNSAGLPVRKLAEALPRIDMTEAALKGARLDTALRELQLNPNRFVVIDKKGLRKALLNLDQRTRVPGEADVRRSGLWDQIELHKREGGFKNIRLNEDQILLPKRVLEEIKLYYNGGGALNKITRYLGTIPKSWASRILLGAGNVSWLNFQVYANATLSGIAGVGPRAWANSAVWWRKLDPETRVGFEGALGVARHYMDIARTEQSSIGFWKGYSQSAVYRYHLRGRSPLDLLFKIDERNNRFFRRAVLHTRVKRMAYKRMDQNFARITTTMDRFFRTKNGKLVKNYDQVVKNISKDRRALDDLTKNVNEFMGDYTSFTGIERALLGRNIMFYGFLRHSIQFTLWNLPVKHPGRLLLLSQLSQMAINDAKDTLNYNKLPQSLLGNFYVKGPVEVPFFGTVLGPGVHEVDLRRASIAGNFIYESQHLGQLGTAFNPVYVRAIEAALGINLFTGKPLRGGPTASYFGESTRVTEALDFDERLKYYGEGILRLFRPYQMMSEVKATIPAWLKNDTSSLALGGEQAFNYKGSQEDTQQRALQDRHRFGRQRREIAQMGGGNEWLGTVYGELFSLFPHPSGAPGYLSYYQEIKKEKSKESKPRNILTAEEQGRVLRRGKRKRKTGESGGAEAYILGRSSLPGGGGGKTGRGGGMSDAEKYILGK